MPRRLEGPRCANGVGDPSPENASCRSGVSSQGGTPIGAQGNFFRPVAALRGCPLPAGHGKQILPTTADRLNCCPSLPLLAAQASSKVCQGVDAFLAREKRGGLHFLGSGSRSLFGMCVCVSCGVAFAVH